MCSCLDVDPEDIREDEHEPDAVDAAAAREHYTDVGSALFYAHLTPKLTL